ncbi:LapA family protein [Kordiimonas sp. SCSIO 12603]|uniref:LapA family protein n=1 Tax=Kordiimonas sp. SCSIO 12603 TaxID=2829596 RepID=UPI002104EEA2|nr:LapA family protein [Kordiimonas sp. SCSIO 12603]UTW58924.1 LapA family protein [Kordiimonas sp. SCSIO 12603]
MGKSLLLLIRRLFWLLIGLALVFFAVNNRTMVQISFEPFWSGFSMPLYLLLFIGIFIGLLVSAFVTGWLRLEGFTKRRKAERRAGYLEDQMSAMAEDAYVTQAARARETAQTGGSVLAKTE